MMDSETLDVALAARTKEVNSHWRGEVEALRLALIRLQQAQSRQAPSQREGGREGAQVGGEEGRALGGCACVVVSRGSAQAECDAPASRRVPPPPPPRVGRGSQQLAAELPLAAADEAAAARRARRVARQVARRQHRAAAAAAADADERGGGGDGGGGGGGGVGGGEEEGEDDDDDDEEEEEEGEEAVDALSGLNVVEARASALYALLRGEEEAGGGMPLLLHTGRGDDGTGGASVKCVGGGDGGGGACGGGACGGGACGGGGGGDAAAARSPRSVAADAGFWRLIASLCVEERRRRLAMRRVSQLHSLLSEVRAAADASALIDRERAHRAELALKVAVAQERALASRAEADGRVRAQLSEARCEELQSTLIAAERRYGDSMRALQASHAGGWRSTQKRLVALEAEARRLKARDGMWSQLCEKQRLLVRAVRAGEGGKLEAARLASEVAAWERSLLEHATSSNVSTPAASPAASPRAHRWQPGRWRPGRWRPGRRRPGRRSGQQWTRRRRQPRRRRRHRSGRCGGWRRRWRCCRRSARPSARRSARRVSVS